MDSDLQRRITPELVKDVIDRGVEVPLKTFGLSMGGTIRSGEWIVVRKTEPDALRPGDIVLYQAKHLFVAHRVVRVWREADAIRIVTKGDGRLECDAPLRGSDILARVVAIRKPGRELRMDSRAGRLLARGQLLYSLFTWRLHRAVRRLPRVRRGARGAGARFLVRLVHAPHRLLVTAWQKLSRPSTR
jgi:signal peptidase I